jgi:hypothetical protein
MEAGSELSFRVPFECSPSLPSLFAQLDNLVAGQDGQPPLLSTYGISVTTLEEVRPLLLSSAFVSHSQPFSAKLGVSSAIRRRTENILNVLCDSVAGVYARRGGS